MSRTEKRLVGPAAASDNANHSSHGALDDLLGARRELDASLALIRVVADNGHVVARGPAERASVANLLLHVGDHGTLRNGAEREDVADGERGVLAGVDELAGVHALVGNEGLGVQLVAVRVTEGDLCERCATAGVVDDLLHDTADVAMALGEVVGAELCRRLVEPLMCVLVFLVRCGAVCSRAVGFVLVWAVKIEPRPFLWLRMTRPYKRSVFSSPIPAYSILCAYHLSGLVGS